ncbi:hypothetical protein A2627_04780 [Candidatus Woesebacteria bacterium RIFCSPHIGHO2_01_FULL_39_28]|uniref:Ribbon-helix-helix protein CopG domain-containing protein n=1 Tax=Candidatus Woesebacteria bacterium RIFCSPHIGHO2_01_FULL_39_28 TaxID=1802496 RepID=A0A1F7YC32_9BACT|nr:MAG: hypothetical protein A2627_04780 [Candidatus Woesebacteria bacterium RIFCSPHIGHO2_01_FULL_39_28]OGM58446.1 MAG: hypothetical protein A3A50_01055 [Candidatus Woesebacteria bacterium RIFCSPLOWO2_01_FULL_38_20]
MQLVATNVRFPKDEYFELKKLALVEDRSIASLIREATRHYKEQKLASKETQRNLFRLITNSAVKIDIPVTKLISSGRKFE